MSKAQNVWRWWLGWRCVAYLAHAFVWGAACTFASLLLSLFYVPMLDGPGSTVDLLIGLSWRSLSMGGVNLVAAFVLYLVWPTIEWMVRPKNRDLSRGDPS